MSNSNSNSNSNSILEKLGLTSIQNLTAEELQKLISSDRQNRAMVRAAGRIKRISKDSSQPKSHKAPPTLASLGFAPALIEKLRASGKSDTELIAMLKEKGVI